AGDAAAAGRDLGDQHLVGQAPRDLVEEAGPQVVHATVCVGRRSIPAIEIVEARRAGVATRHPLDLADRLVHARALLAQLLALARLERAEEVVPARPAAIAPVVLEARARRVAGLAERGLLVGGAEQPVDRLAAG